MKKIFLTLIAAVAMVAAPVFMSSCSSDDDGPSSKEVVLKAPKYANEAKKLTFTKSQYNGISSIEFTESGKAVLTIQPAAKPAVARRAEATQYTVTGMFVMAGDAYLVDCPDFKETVTVKGNQATVAGETFEVEVSKPVSSDARINRTWNVNNTFVYDGVASRLSNHKYGERAGYPTQLTLTKAGTIILTFSDGVEETGSYSVAAGDKVTVANQIASMAFDNLMFNFLKVVTVGCTVDGHSYKISLTSVD